MKPQSFQNEVTGDVLPDLQIRSVILTTALSALTEARSLLETLDKLELGDRTCVKDQHKFSLEATPINLPRTTSREATRR